MPEENIQQQTADVVEPTTPVEPTKPDEEIQNPQNLLKALNLYKEQVGSVKDAQKMREQAALFASINDAITAEGFDPTDLPKLVQQVKEKEAKDKEVAEQYQAKLQLLENDYRKQLAESERRAIEAETARLNDRRARSVFPIFNANALPEATTEWDEPGGYWDKLSKFIEFEENGSDIKRVLGPDGQALFISEPGKETREADLTDLIAGCVDGKYGFSLKQAMKPVSMATGGGIVNPSRGGANTISSRQLGSKTPAQLKEIKNKVANGELRIVD